MKPDPSARAAPIGPLTPHLYTPTAARPLRAKLLRLRADTRVVPHAHPWGQVALSSTGVIRVTAPHGSYIVPPSRAVWIPPGVEHAVTVIEDAELLTLYLHQPRSRCGPARSAAESAGWRQCRVLEVSSLLLALALAARRDARRRRRRRRRARRSRASAASPRSCSTSCAAPRRFAWASTCRRKSGCAASAKR